MRVLLVAVVSSALMRLFFAAPIPEGDPAIYLQLANSITSGNGMIRFSPTLGIYVQALHPPLYPMFLSLFVPHVALANFAIDLAGAGAILWLARALRIPGELPAATWLLFTVLWSPIPHKEGLVAALTVASAAAAIDKRFILLGMFGALLALTQPGLAPLPALLAIALVPPRHWPVVAAAGLVVMLPWWFRNWMIFGAFVPLTTSSGYGLWLGAFADHRWIPLPARLLAGDELGISRAASLEAWRQIGANPIRFVAGSLLHALPLAASPALIAALSAERLRTIMGLALINLFAFQIWFELGPRHLWQFLPLALLYGASVLKVGEHGAVKIGLLRRIEASTDNRSPQGNSRKGRSADAAQSETSAV